ncbi:MAG: sugar ABC transporter ATP-binding protein [Candidatus Limnocylindria bacterium]
MTTPSNPSPLLELRRVGKSYPGVRALDNVDFDLRPGEVHGVVGENGAGKSTLIRIIGGVIQPDEGELLVDGRPIDISSPQDAQNRGVSVIHQELEVHPALSVTENVMLGRLPSRPPGWVDWRRAERETSSLLAAMALDISPRTKVGALSLAERRLIVIARALAVKARVLVMDEPTAGLSEAETDHLGQLIQRMRRSGASIIYVSHRVSEVIALADRITVLRDGRRVATVAAAEASVAGVVRSMVGRDLAELYPRRRQQSGPVALELRDLGGPGFRSVNMSVRSGEIVALYGLLGSGCANVSRAIFGAPPATTGAILVNDRSTPIRRPTDARRAGIGLLPIERRREGLVLASDVMVNIVLASIERYARGGLFRDREARERARHWGSRLSIRMTSSRARVATLSGGNQQKVIFARWLDASSRILVLEEPTRGVDVGAKGEIYRLIDELCQQGVAVVLVSSEIPEVLAISDRILVMSRGRIVAEFGHDQATKELLVSNAAA